jgi:hypothetical protein
MDLLSLFDAFTDLGGLIACALVLGAMLCLPHESGEHRNVDWTMRPRRK